VGGNGLLGVPPERLTTDVLIIGAGAAGLTAARTALMNGAQVVLVDKGLIGQGGATIMAQMTVAAALGSEEPDDWTLHYQDMLTGGRGLNDPALAEALARDAPARILECAEIGVRWVRRADGGIKQVMAPGHSRKRCVYVDFLSSGPAIIRALKGDIRRRGRCTELKNVSVHRLLVGDEGEVAGAFGVDLALARPVVVRARSVVLATGGCTYLFARTSASINMTGDGYALALRAGAELVDMEFIQFFPIGTVFPRLIGLDPVMWDPFRYKLGGKLLNGRHEEFVEHYSDEVGRYTALRDAATYAILNEIKAGRGSPHGGVYLDFRGSSRERLRDAFGGVIDILERQGLDLTRQPVEVAPLAHYTIGGIRVNERMETRVPGLYAAGEATGGANGANRLSGNALIEALTFGHRAGEHAAKRSLGQTSRPDTARSERQARESLGELAGRNGDISPAGIRHEIQRELWANAGPFRTASNLEHGLARLHELGDRDLPYAKIAGPLNAFNLDLLECLNLDHALLTAEAVVQSALARRESRGAHQREDYPESDDAWLGHHVQHLAGEQLRIQWTGRN
jgi:succinate dehydrogenase / fumarate reductase flavoprotein subunit/fumarate reductase (CoM/CoB) subunit A